MNVFDLSAKITMDINGYLKSMDTAKAVALSTFSVMGGAVSGFMDDSIESGKKFDASMSQVAATMGKSMVEMADETGTADTAFGKFDGTLREFAQFMGRNTAFTASQAADALNYMALAGYNTQESMDMLPNVLNLAAAGNMDLARASDMVTDTQTAFGISAKRTTQMVDEMAKAASTGNTSVEQLGDAFLVVGGLTQELNGGLVELEDGTWATVDGVQELEIALTAMANAGVKGSEAGTHMRNMIMKLSSPTKEGAQAFEDMGVKVFDAEGKMRSLGDIFNDLNTELSSMSQEEKIKTISKIFNARDLSSAEALLNAIGSDWDAIGRSILDAEGAAGKMSEVQLDNLAGDTTKFESALEGLQIALSDAVTPAMREMKQIGTVTILELTEAFQGLPKEAQTAIALVGEFGGKALAATPQIVGMAGSLAQLKTAQALTNSTTLTFIKGLGGVASAAGIAGAAIATIAIAYIGYKAKLDWATEAQREMLDAMNSASDAYSVTHDRVTQLTEDTNEYRSSEERAAELESMRVSIVDSHNDAIKRKSEAEAELKEVESQLAVAANDLTTTWEYGDDQMVDYTYDTDILKEKQKQLNETIAEADSVINQTDSDLAVVNDTIKGLTTTQEAHAEAVEEVEQSYQEFLLSIPKQTVETATSIVESVLTMQESLSNAASSIGNWFDEVAKEEEKSAATMKENLQAQISHMKDWESDLAYLADKGINKEFLQYLADMGPSASSYVVAMKKDVISGGQSTVDEWNALYREKLDLEKGVNDEAQNVYDAIIEMGDGGREAFEKVIKEFGISGEDAGDNMTLGLVNALKSGLDDVEEAGKEVGEAGTEGVDEGAGTHSPSTKTKATGENMGAGLILGLRAQIALVYAAGAGMANNAVNGANSVGLYGQGVSIGYNFDLGISAGISSYAYLVASAAANAAQSAINSAKSRMQIASPSKVGDWIGEMWDKGIAGGILDNAIEPIKAAGDLAKKIIDETDAGMSTLDFDYASEPEYEEAYDGVGDEEEYEYYDSEANEKPNITINVYGSEGQDVRELAEIVSEELATMFNEEEAVWA